MARKAKDHSKTKIYKFNVNGKEYFGHTTTTLASRKAGHVRDFKAYPNRKVFKAISDAGLHMKDIELILVEHYPCNSEEEAKARERYWVEKKGELNSYIPNRGRRERRDANRDEFNRKKREWRAANRDELNRKEREKRAENGKGRERVVLNREEINRRKREKQAAYREANRDEYNRKMREWRAAKRIETTS